MPSTITHPAWIGGSDPLDLACRCASRDTAYCYLGQHAQCPAITQGPEGYLSAPGRTSTHIAVWLADRTCRRVCECECHQSMHTSEAAWVREYVWTQPLRRSHENVPGSAMACACQYGTSIHCQREHHDACHRADAFPGPESYITRASGQVVSFAGAYEHPAPSATGAHRGSVAQVWLADRVCRWVCDCECHLEPEPTPEPEPEYEQDALF